MSASSLYVVTYRNPDKADDNVVVRVRSISDSQLGPTFVSLSEFVFSSSNSGLINPQDEYAKKRFTNTKTLHLSIYSILTIEEVGGGNAGLSLASKEGQILNFDPNKQSH